MTIGRKSKLKYLALSVSSLALAACATSPVTETEAPTVEEASTEVVKPIAPVEEALFDFADISDLTITANNADYEILSGEDGATSLAIQFNTEEDSAGIGISPAEPLDFANIKDKNIAFEVKNTGHDSIQLFLGMESENGLFQNRHAPIAPGEKRTVYTVINGAPHSIDGGMRELPAPWAEGETMMIWGWGTRNEEGFDNSTIKQIGFFIRGNIREKSVEISNLRLRPNKPVPEDYLKDIVDAYGQNAKADFPIKVSSDAELRAVADAELADLKANPVMADRSRFGGWKTGPRLKATGYFRVEKVNDQWWLVDPEGYLFFSNGLANVRMANLTTLTGVDFKDDSIRYVDPNEVTPEDSIGIVNVPDDVRETRFIASELRHDMFSWLPEYDDPLADHYSYRRSVHRGPMTSGETYSFYRANLELRYGETEPESYIRKWEDVTLARMKSWGFTSMGNWVDPAFYPNEQVPYFANGWIIGDYQTLTPGMDVWGPMPDFYDPLFAERAEATISVIAEEVQGTPWCVGVFIDNEKSWGRPTGPVTERLAVIVDAMRRDASESYAKAAFMDLLKARYTTIEALNAAWETDLESWAALADGYETDTYSEGYEQDLSMMMLDYSDKYFSIVDSTLEKHLPNHLYMGARMASWGMPEETVEAALKYSDIMSFNIYDDGLQDHQWAFFDDIDKPVVIGEFHIGAISDTGLFHPGLVSAVDQADRASGYIDYMETVTTNPYLVGAHWFQYVDSPLTGRAFDGENYNVGFVSNTDIPYPEMIKAARTVNRDLYTKRFTQTNDQSE